MTAVEGWAFDNVRNERADAFFVQRVRGDGVLAAGATTLAVDVDIPPRTAPSHAHGPARALLVIHVHVAMPNGHDGHYQFTAMSRVAPPLEVARTPATAMSPAVGVDPRLELRLPSSRVIAGESLVGTCTQLHFDDKEPRKVTFALIAKLTLRRSGTSYDTLGGAITATVVLPARSAGTPVPFELALPAALTPSFTAGTHDLAWTLTARAGSFFSGKVEVAVPIEVVDVGALATTARLAPVPSLATERIAVAFTRFAGEHGWRIDDDDHTAAISIAKDHAGAALHVSYATRGPDGAFSIARIASPSLGLGLSVSPSSALRNLLSRDIEVDIEEWDAAHFVRARSAEQTVPVLHAIVTAIASTSHLGAIARWTDEALVFEQPIGTFDLLAIASELERVAAAIEQARATIAPPPGLEVDMPAWHDLARWLGGKLVAGDLSIAGSLAQSPVRLALRFDDGDQPTAVHASVGESITAGERVDVALSRPTRTALRAPPRVSELLMAWPASFVDLRIVDGVASAAWLIGDDRAADAAQVRLLVESLRAIVATLSHGTTGPYR